MLVALVVCSMVVAAASPKVVPLDGARIERLTGASGAAKGRVFRVEQPRKDLDVYVGENPVTAAMGLASWAAFQRADKGDLVVGQLALLEDQAKPALAALLAGGLQITGIDRHFAGESPRMVFVHFSATGGLDALAGAVGKAFDVARTQTGGGGPKLAHLETSHRPLDAKKLTAVLGAGTVVPGGFRVERSRVIKLRGQSLDSAEGAASWATLSGADDAAAVAGSIVATDAALQSVLAAAQQQGLTVTAVDSPWLGEQPHVNQIHVWGTGTALQLAHAIAATMAKAE